MEILVEGAVDPANHWTVVVSLSFEKTVSFLGSTTGIQRMDNPSKGLGNLWITIAAVSL
jgi:hypothetical protein